MDTAIEQFMGKADLAVGSSYVLLRLEDSDGACNQAYTAMRHAAVAAILQSVKPSDETIDLSSDDTVWHAVDMVLVNGGRISKLDFQAFSDARDLSERTLADSECVDWKQARSTVRNARDFVQSIRMKFNFSRVPGPPDLGRFKRWQNNLEKD